MSGADLEPIDPTDDSDDGEGEVAERSLGDLFDAQQWFGAGLGGNAYGGFRYEERIPATFAGYARAAYGACGPVFACVSARQMVFAEGRFVFQRLHRGRPDALFGTPALGLLESPWPGGTTGELLARMEADVSLCGNSFWVRRGDRLARLAPDRVGIVVGVPDDPELSAYHPDAEVLGYVYTPDGGTGAAPLLFDVADVAHYSPIPDPLALYRGMSWLTPIIREINADLNATEYRAAYFKNGATPSAHFKVDPHTSDAVLTKTAEYIRDFFAGPSNAGRVLITSADFVPIASTFRDSEMKALQGAGESRIAAAAGAPPIIAGFSEGLQAATYSNYSQARRRFADGTMRPLWRMAADSLSTLVDVPVGAELVVDTRYIAALREDEADQAQIMTRQAASIRQLIDAGFKPDAAVLAVTGGDLRALEGGHTGHLPVQVQPGGDQ